MKTFIALLTVPLAALAQTVLPTEFPADAQAASPEALREHLAGRVFKAQPASGPGWRLEYKSNGYVFLDTSTGYRDTGRWSVEGLQLCAQWERAPSGCGETRLLGPLVYIKRSSNGEVVALVPQ